MSGSNLPHTPLPQQPPPAPACSLAYLSSQYQGLSLVFIMREVLALRELGIRIETASINPPDRPLDRLTAVEAAEAARTYCIKEHGVGGAAVAHMQSLLTNFLGYGRGLILAVRLAGLDLRRFFFNFMYFTEALMVGQWMRRNRLRHLHVHLATQAASVGLFVRHTFGFGYSLTVHGPDEFYDARRHYLSEKIAAADFICCISFFARSQLMMLSPYVHWHKLVIARVGIDPKTFSPQPGKPARDSFDILCIGRLTPAKGQHLLIDAVERLARQGRSVQLRLAGVGTDEASLREHAARIDHPECVVFEGAVDQDGIRALYAAADVFCLPSFAEGIPGVLMEAMAMEIPCVTTHITGIPELIRNGIDGLLVAPSDLEALVGALARLMDDEALRKRIAVSGRARVLEFHNLRRNAEELAAILNERVKS
jgi:glycosyltransferase involved in cell wall biosynthesis